MQCYSVPADFKSETIKAYVRLNKKYGDKSIYETYGQITIDNLYGSGRSFNLLPTVDFKTLKGYIALSAYYGIRFNYTMNSTCMGNMELTENGKKNLESFFQKLYEVGVRSITVALPSVIQLIQSLSLDFEIKASAACRIDNANKAEQYKQLGANRIVIHESIYRDFSVLSAICERFGKATEIIVNSICHRNCIYQGFHFNQSSHENSYTSTASSSYYTHRCMLARSRTPGDFLKLAWIRPEDIHAYEKIGITYFKIQGRHLTSTGNIPKTVECYLSGHYDGNLFYLLDCFAPTNSFIPDIPNYSLKDFMHVFIKNNKFCKDNCIKCRYCDEYAQKHLDYNRLNELCKKIKLFYENY